ncbi:MAG TPA: SOS response-associated peptidase [Fimbriimonadaceae bacterium]
MCARFTLRVSAEAMKELFDLDELPELLVRYNIAPTQDVSAVTQSREGERMLRPLRWGLVPSWAKSLAVGSTMINARSESLHERGAFRTAFEKRRCLIPSDGFFEWKEVTPEEEQGSLFGEPTKVKAGKPKKQPYHFTLRDGKPFAFAGLWERWSDPEGHVVDTCTIVTTAANELVAKLHDRMPVILAPEDYALWLDRHECDTAKLMPLMSPYPSERMKATAVNPVVGNSRIDTPECVQPFNAA